MVMHSPVNIRILGPVMGTPFQLLVGGYVLSNIRPRNFSGLGRRIKIPGWIPATVANWLSVVVLGEEMGSASDLQAIDVFPYGVQIGLTEVRKRHRHRSS